MDERAIEFDLPVSLLADRYVSAIQAAVVAVPPTATGILAIFASGKQTPEYILAAFAVGLAAFVVAFFAPKTR